jgi:hypothetical protein
MSLLYWVSAGLLVLMLVPALVFFVLYLGTREEVAKDRGLMFWRFAMLVVLGTANIAIFGRVVDAVRALF